MKLQNRLTQFFAPGGTLERAHAGFEPRPEQAAMAAEVLLTLESGGHLLVEAGTGTGKTLAYLVPALLAGRPVVVSTGTRALQDQIALKDVPFLKEKCHLAFEAVVLKGRDNYLCRHRFDAFDAAPGLFAPGEAAVWPLVRRWAAQTTTGDVAELTELAENPAFWPEVNAKDSTCLGSRCPQFQGCHLQDLRRRARDADLVIVNHYLYLADAAVRASQFGQVLPDHDLAIFDEAHSLPEAASAFFGRTVSSWRLRELADDTARELARTDAASSQLLRWIDDVARAAAGLVDAWARTEGRVVLPARLESEQEDALRGARSALRALAAAFAALLAPPPAVEPLARRCALLDEDLALIVDREDDSYVYWSERRGRGVFLTATPIDLAPLLRERVFDTLQASVSCSATLALDGTLAHARRQFGLDDEAAGQNQPRGRRTHAHAEVVIDVHADVSGSAATGSAKPVRESIHASPFDFARQGLLYLPENVPDPRDKGFASACAREALELVSASRGRAFLLFTSFDNLRRVHALLEGQLDHPVLVQGEAPRHELLRRFQERLGSVLFATASFWEGVDVPGEALSLVVIDKLPFGVPTDPIVAARSRQLEQAGGSPFLEIALPEAILTLKQGVGRLIRSRRDRGVVALLDPRVTTTRYGRTFLMNLPPLARTRQVADVRAFFEQSSPGAAGA